MSHIFTLLLSFFASTQDAEAFRTTAPADLTLETAREHLGAARYIAEMANVDPALLLAIAWHESRYVVATRTAEPGHKTSCGVMTPVPQVACVTPTLLEGYAQGAAHLRTWFDAAHGNERTALLGYAGGYRLIKACAAGPAFVERQGHQVDLCTIVGVFQWRARMIRKALATLRVV